MEENKNETPIKNGNGGLKAIVAIVIIAILAGVAYFFLRPTTPKSVFVGGINSAIEKSSQKLGEEVKKINTTITLSGNIEANDESIKQIASYINDGKISYNVQIDRETKKALFSAGVDYKNENLLSGKIFFANDDDNIYFYVQDLFDKYFKFNLKEVLEDENDISILKDIFTADNSKLSERINLKKASNILKDEISKNLKDEYFSNEKVDGTTKNTMKLTIGELKQVAKNIVTSLKDNEEFLKCYEKPENIKKILEGFIEKIDGINADYDSQNVEFSIYTKGLKNEAEKFEVVVYASETDKVVLTIANVEENKFEIKLDAGEYGKVTLNVEIKNEKDTDLEKIDVSNSVEVNNMSEGDMFKLYGNLMNMKIYQYLGPLFMGEIED